MVAETTEKSAPKPRCAAACVSRCSRSMGQRRPNHNMAGVNAAQMYMAAIQPMKTGSQGTGSLR